MWDFNPAEPHVRAYMVESKSESIKKFILILWLE